MSSSIRIGSRSSALAMVQSELVMSLLGKKGVASVIQPFTTSGDKILDRPLAAIGGKGLFTAELEAALLDGTIDCAVHSLKDLPTSDPDGLEIIAILERHDPRDALVVAQGKLKDIVDIHDLPKGSRIGTSSLRRKSLLLSLRPDLEVMDLRGNVGTRLRKLDEGQLDAAILAAAGLDRLGLSQRVVARLDSPQWISAPGQGAIAVQARSNDDRVRALLSSLEHSATRVAVTAERALLATLEGGCQIPIGARVLAEGSELVLHAFVASIDGSVVIKDSLIVNPLLPSETGITLANKLLSKGADKILSDLRGHDKN